MATERSALAVKDQRDDSADLFHERIGRCALRLKHCPEVGRHVEQPALVVLRRPRLESDDASLEIDLGPGKGKDLASRGQPVM